MASITGFLRDLYIRFMVWLGAAPPEGYDHLASAGEAQQTPAPPKIEPLPEVPAPDDIVEEPASTILPGEPPAPEVTTPEAELSVDQEPAAGDKVIVDALPSVDEPAPPVEAPVQPPIEETAPEPLPGLPLEDVPSIVEEPSLEEVVLPPLEGETTGPEPDLETEPGLAPEMDFRYEVQRGDTLSAIARRYGITVNRLIEANDIPDSSVIYPGQKLTIPGYLTPSAEPTSPPALPDEYITHTVTPGETLSTIAKRYGVTLRQLVQANNIQDPSQVGAGQTLIVPGLTHRPETEVEPPPPPSPRLEVKEPPQPPRPAVIVDPAFPPLGPPEAVRALYLSYFALGRPDFIQQVFELLDTTELNAVVIDAKGDHGYISYPTRSPMAQEIGAARPTATDFETVMATLKARGVYTIARLVTFKDTPLAKSHPDYAVKVSGGSEIWQDREQLSWSDPFLKPVWDYNIQLAMEAATKGFDEIQFDYIRFPTASHAGSPSFSQEISKEARVAAITGFLSLAYGQLKRFGVKIAANTFGYTCWRQDDTQIGQDIGRLSQHIDVLCPMLYPSTFGSGIPGYKVAIAHPYEVVYESARRAVTRVRANGCEVRPWIQDFPDYRFDKRVYGREEIQAQIKACFDAGSSGFLVWDPMVNYTNDAYAPLSAAATAEG